MYPVISICLVIGTLLTSTFQSQKTKPENAPPCWKKIASYKSESDAPMIKGYKMKKVEGKVKDNMIRTLLIEGGKDSVVLESPSRTCMIISAVKGGRNDAVSASLLGVYVDTCSLR